MRLLINASNLHNGGGVAVASSVIDEISRMPEQSHRVTVIASPSVAKNLQEFGTQRGAFAGFSVFETVGISALWTRYPFDARKFDRVLNVFGPVYNLRMARNSVMGFAQPWIAFPNNAAYGLLSRTERLKSRFGFFVKTGFFLLSDTLVVEQPVVAQSLRHRRAFRNKKMSVVASAVDTVFWEPQRWEEIDLGPSKGVIKLGVVAGAYPHKNLQILPAVKQSLATNHGVNADIFVTLKSNEWESQSPEFRRSVVNVGPLTLSQCPTFLSQLDAVVFPTLLECFSATPIEASAVGVPLFASDLPTIRETVGEYATYIDPLDADSIADRIVAKLLVEDLKSRERIPQDSPFARPGASRLRAIELLKVCGLMPELDAYQESEREMGRNQS